MNAYVCMIIYATNSIRFDSFQVLLSSARFALQVRNFFVLFRPPLSVNDPSYCHRRRNLQTPYHQNPDYVY